jgi:hypothetical protein
MRSSSLGETLIRVLFSPANWLGLGFAAACIVLIGLGFVSARYLALGLLAYAVGFAVGGAWFGWPQLSGPDWRELTFSDNENTREAAARALAGIRRLVDTNPGRRLSAATGIKLTQLCDSLEAMLAQWDSAKQGLSLEDTFHARHIALRYLPEALQRFWAIPPQLAQTKALSNGLTADATLGQTVDELSQKVRQLSEALAAHDTQAFLDHSKFLSDKFGGPTKSNPNEPVALR